MSLVDGHGREIGDLRISVTDRCNFRCQYCMPAEGLPWLERDAVLHYEELSRLIGLLGRMGVHDVRLTGGEPLARRDLHHLVALLTADGRLRTCLFSLNETDLRGPLRDGATDEDLAAIVRDAVWRKELKHHINEPGFIQPERSMSQIGG